MESSVIKRIIREEIKSLLSEVKQPSINGKYVGDFVWEYPNTQWKDDAMKVLNAANEYILNNWNVEQVGQPNDRNLTIRYRHDGNVVASIHVEREATESGSAGYGVKITGKYRIAFVYDTKVIGAVMRKLGVERK